MYLRVLRTEHLNEEIQEKLQAMQMQLAAVSQFCTEQWKPSKEQVVSVVIYMSTIGLPSGVEIAQVPHPTLHYSADRVLHQFGRHRGGKYNH